MSELLRMREARARAVAEAGSVAQALAEGLIPARVDLTLSEGLVLGLLLQGVETWVGVFGHGSTEVGEVLAVYERAGVVRTVGVRNEVEASHAAAALRWTTGEKAAVFTSIGPGALQAMAGSLMPASDGLGVWYVMGDETTEDEGPNMQQLPLHQQGGFLKLFSAMGQAYSLHTPRALGSALRQGQTTVDHPFRPAPFYLLLPMNTQPSLMESFPLGELPRPQSLTLGPATDREGLAAAVDALLAAKRVVVKAGGGARRAGPELARFLDLADGVLVHTPIATGLLPWSSPRNLGVGGSKGSICGNFAMDNADLVVAVGTRFVCQSDSSRTGYPRAEAAITINPDPYDANHYSRNIPLLGDAAATLEVLSRALEARGVKTSKSPSPWLEACIRSKQEWQSFKAQRTRGCPTLFDDEWQREVLTQPAAIHIAHSWARRNRIPSFFDAGDVQANGFQMVEDEHPGMTFTDTGASYMGFAVSALLAGALSRRPFYSLAFTGDGSFFMNPQILIDGVEQGVRGCILLMDNRRMGAISSLQKAQYNRMHATWDRVVVDYAALAGSVRGVQALWGGCSPQELEEALEQAKAWDGLTLIHLPVYFGEDPLGGLGAFGRWNVGSWVEATQKLRHDQGW